MLFDLLLFNESTDEFYVHPLFMTILPVGTPYLKPPELPNIIQSTPY